MNLYYKLLVSEDELSDTEVEERLQANSLGYNLRLEGSKEEILKTLNLQLCNLIDTHIENNSEEESQVHLNFKALVSEYFHKYETLKNTT